VNELLGLGEGEGRRALRQLALVFVASAALVLLKAAQGGIFLSAYPRSAIPWAFAASAFTLATFSALAVAMAARLGPVRLAAITLVAGAVGSLALRGLLATGVPGAPFALYVVIEATAGLVLIQTWSVVSGTVDPRSAKRILPVAGVGASVAWTLGGLLVPRLVSLIGAPGLLVVAPLLLLGAAALVRTIGRMDLAPASSRPVTSGASSLLAGWRSGLSFVSEVPLMRLCMALSVLALLAEQLMDFQLLSSARERLGDQAAITAFFGRFYGITSAIGLVFQLALSGRLLARLGAVRGLVVTPAVTVLCALFAIVMPGFLAMVLLRGSDRVLKGALFSSAMEQTQTPLPVVRRAQARALSRGVIAPVAYAFAALGLAVLPPHFDLRLLTLFTLLTSLAIVAVIALGLRRAYVLALRRAIDDRRLRLDGPVDEASVAPLDAEAAEVIARDLEDADEGKALLAAELLAHADPLVAGRLLPRGLAHASPAVRTVALDTLGRLGAGNAAGVADRLSHDPISDVRKAAVRALFQSRAHDDGTRRALDGGTRDTDRRVRASCEIALLALDDADGVRRGTALVPLLVAEEPERCLAALEALAPRAGKTPAVVAALRKLLVEADDPRLRLAALEAAGRVGARSLLADVGPLLEDARTTEGAVAHLLRWGQGALETAAESVVSPSVRSADAVPESEALSRLLSHDDAGVRDRTTRALSRLVNDGRREPLPRAAVEPLLEREVETGFRYLSLLAGVAHDDGTADWEIADEFAFLGREIDLRFRAARQRVLQLLSLLASRRLAGTVEAGMRRSLPGASGHMEAQVAELLEMALPPRLARRVVPLFDRLTLRERIKAAERVDLLDRAAMDDPLAWIVAAGDRTLRVCAMITYGARAADRFPDAHAEDVPLIPVFERMRFLRSVPLFAELPGDDLRTVAEILETVERPAGDCVFKKGEPGEDMYVIVRGRVVIRDGEAEIASLGPREFFGELSVIDREARSADAFVVEAAELLRLRAADLGELMARRPQIQEQILLVLVRRLRTLNARVAH